MIDHSKGTYSAIKVLPGSVKDINDWCKLNKIKCENNLHCTLIYSTRPCPNIEVDPSVVYTATIKDLALFSNKDQTKKVLVLKLNSPLIYARHILQMEKNNATYDFATYEPHVTVCYDYHGDASSLTIPNFTIYLGSEYVNGLDA